MLAHSIIPSTVKQKLTISLCNIASERKSWWAEFFFFFIFYTTEDLPPSLSQIVCIEARKTGDMTAVSESVCVCALLPRSTSPIFFSISKLSANGERSVYSSSVRTLILSVSNQSSQQRMKQSKVPHPARRWNDKDFNPQSVFAASGPSIVGIAVVWQGIQVVRPSNGTHTHTIHSYTHT